jgi:glutamate decarboxylase
MLSKKVDLNKLDEEQKNHASTYGMRYFSESVPKYEIPEEGMPSYAAYRLIHDELNLDGNPSLNLASFVTTWMEPDAKMLIDENLHKNFIDQDEYPRTAEIQDRVVNMLARLFNAPHDAQSLGTSTLGSSEAIMLALLAHKWSWRIRRKAEGKPDGNPNLVMGSDVHTVWEKFARYFDVEPRVIPMTKHRFTINAEEVGKLVDENTICVGAVLGTTFTGQADPIKEVNDLLLEIKERKGLDIPLHVDGASGGFITPFSHPELEWDFRLPQVRSINTSGHKFGMVYPGIGWLIFRDKSDLPEELIFKINYLGGEMPSYTLNFSKGSAMMLAQYYNLLRLGRSGYREIVNNMFENARYLTTCIEAVGRYELLGAAKCIPVIVGRMKEKKDFTVYDISRKLREKGWIVPAYTLPPNADSIAVLRVVVKENFSREMAEALAEDAANAYDELERSGFKGKTAPAPKGAKAGKIC